MRVLICVSGNAPDFKFEYNQVFVFEQIKSICQLNVGVDYRVFSIKGKGIRGYLSSLKRLKEEIKDYNPDLIHAHCGHVGALAVLQRRVPVITTFHGSDINNRMMRPISSFASLFSTFSIFVSNRLRDTLRIKGKDSMVIPCGVDFRVFHPMDKMGCKKQLGLDPSKDYILFASHFDNIIKNPKLARAVASHFPLLSLLEIKGRSRNEVALLINGAELVLMTSISEGSPQIIKEAIACGTPIVTVDVGDVREQLNGVPGSWVCQDSEPQLVEAVAAVLASEHIQYDAPQRYNNDRIATMIFNIYKSITNGDERI